MKHAHLLIIGALIGATGFYFYEKKKAPKNVINNAFFNNKGYTNMMKLSPIYYNGTSTESVGSNPGASNAIATPWVLPAEQGNAMEISAGWASIPDTYSAKVSNAWLQQEAQEARL